MSVCVCMTMCMSVCMYGELSLTEYVSEWACVCVCVYVCVCVCMCVCLLAYVCVFAQAHTHTYAHECALVLRTLWISRGIFILFCLFFKK